MKANRVIGAFLWLAVIIAAFYVVPRWLGVGHVEKPPAFDAGLTLATARSASATDKKPVLIFATADWCPPCKEMKRTTLRETNVEKTIRADFNAVYLDVDANAKDGADLKVFSIPTTIVMIGDQELARVEGFMDAGSYLSWLEAAWAQAKSGVVPQRSRDLGPGDTPRPAVGSDGTPAK